MKPKNYMRLSLICMLLIVLMQSVSFARDSYSTITGVGIRVSDSLRDLKAGEQWPSISKADFEVNNTDKYSIDYVQWYDNNHRDEMEVGDKGKVIVYLTAGSKKKSGGDEIIYRFSGSYGSSNVRVSYGEFVSARRRSNQDMEIVLLLPPVKGQYSEPEELKWSAGRLGTAVWSSPYNDSGYYEVVLYHYGKKVVSHTTSTRSLNLYPWMEREGDYTFSVATIPHTQEQKRYGKKSDMVESDYLYISDNRRSDGSGKYDSGSLISSGTTGISSINDPGSGSQSPAAQQLTVGWYQNNGGWYFRYPNQQLISSNWLNWKDRWYHFDAQGRMQTGWFRSSHGNWFYLDPQEGHAKLGWQLINGVWYYFNPQKGDNEGIMYSSSISRIGNDDYYFDQNGAMRTGWMSVKDSAGNQQYYYFYEDGRMARNTEISGFHLDGSGRWVH